MNSSTRNSARDRVKGEEKVPREDAIRALLVVSAAYVNPGEFKPGDIVQTREFLAALSGHTPRELAPMVVLEVVEDLAEVTDNEDQRGVMGLRIGMVVGTNTDRPGIAMRFEEAWSFEPYTGPMPDAH